MRARSPLRRLAAGRCGSIRRGRRRCCPASAKPTITAIPGIVAAGAQMGNRLGRLRDGRRHQRHARRRRDLRARADRHDPQARGRRQGVHGREPDARRRLRVARCARPALCRRAHLHRAAEHVPAGLQRPDGRRAAAARAQGARDVVRERRAARPLERSDRRRQRRRVLHGRRRVST